MIVVVDNITYLLDTEKKNATVTRSLEPYSGCVTIPDTIVCNAVEYMVADILDEAFAGCTGLQTVVMGANVESVGISAFEGCSMLCCVL